MMFKFYIWVMGWSGKINTWAWNKQVDIVRANQRKEEEDYLKELKKKLLRSQISTITLRVNKSRTLTQEKEFTK